LLVMPGIVSLLGAQNECQAPYRQDAYLAGGLPWRSLQSFVQRVKFRNQKDSLSLHWIHSRALTFHARLTYLLDWGTEHHVTTPRLYSPPDVDRMRESTRGGHVSFRETTDKARHLPAIDLFRILPTRPV
jgi:hypothetical protein